MNIIVDYNKQIPSLSEQTYTIVRFDIEPLCPGLTGGLSTLTNRHPRPLAASVHSLIALGLANGIWT
jgi:hypothetical protein